MTRPAHLRGIEAREVRGGTRYRAAKVRVGAGWSKPGPWRDSLAAARGDRNRLLGRQQSGALAAEASELPTFRAAATAWLDAADRGQALARGRRAFAPKTLRGYRQDMERYHYPAYGDTPVDRVRRSAIQAVVDEVHAVASGQRARNVATPAQALYRYLLTRHDDLADPTVGLDLPAGSSPRERIAAPEELDALVAAAPGVRDRAAFALCAYAGLRAGEVAVLGVGDVLAAEGWLTVREGLDAIEGARVPKSRAGVRRVPIFDRLRPHLDAQLAALGPGHEGLLFPGRSRHGTMSMSGLLVRLRVAWDAAGLGEGLVLHEARHSFASHLVAAGYDVATVARWIGHSHASTTLDRYVKPVEGGRATERMAAWLADRQGGA